MSENVVKLEVDGMAMKEVSDPLCPEPASEVQQVSEDDSAATHQRDDRPCPENDWHVPKEDHSREGSESIILTDKTDESKDLDCKDESYIYYHSTSYSNNNEMETFASNQCSLKEDTGKHNISNTICEQQDKKPPVDYDKKYVQDQIQQNNYIDNNHNTGKDESKYFVYPEEHSYQRKLIVMPNEDTQLETSYGYHTTDETINQTDEPSTLQNESHTNRYPERTCFIQVEDQETYQERIKEHSNDNTKTFQREDVSPDNREECVINKYIYSGSDHVYQDKHNYNISRDPCHDRYYSYEVQHEKTYQDEVTEPMEQQISQEQSYIYQPEDGRFFNREGPTTKECGECQDSSYSYLQCINDSENQTYIINKEPYQERNFQDNDAFQRKSSIVVEEGNGYICEEDSTFQRDETSAVDLRMLRPLSYPTSSDDLQSSYNNFQESMSISQVSDGYYHIEHSRENVSPSQNAYNQDNNSSKSNYLVPDQTCYEEEYSDSTQHLQENKSLDCSICETADVEHHKLWDVATNTDHNTVMDKECQTGSIEVRDMAVQTDVKPKGLPFAFLKNIQEEIAKHTCPICQRVYISKSSFDRHLRTHEKAKNNVFANVRFTTEAKLEICKRAGKSKNSKAQKPIIIQVPRSIFQCDMCERIFPNQRGKDNHDCTFKPFALTKCPECHIKFYTTGALNEHIGIVHKKENAYYCIFCNKSFNAGYNFHLHLDEHLSTQ